jgi:hypothetical protein
MDQKVQASLSILVVWVGSRTTGRRDAVLAAVFECTAPSSAEGRVRCDYHSCLVTGNNERSGEHLEAADGPLLSPELALVDPTEGERARRALPGIVLTEDSMQLRRGGEAQSEEHEGVEMTSRFVEAANVRGPVGQGRRLRRPVFALLAAISILCAVAAVRIGFGAGDKRGSAGTGTSTIGDSAVLDRSNVSAKRSIPDFVWVPAKRAVGYRVEFLRHARVVHTVTTRVPRLHVAAAKLPRGSYRWEVWALDKAGAREGRAIVDASVTVP